MSGRENQNHGVNHVFGVVAEGEPPSDLGVCAPPGTRTPNPLIPTYWDRAMLVVTPILPLTWANIR